MTQNLFVLTLNFWHLTVDYTVFKSSCFILPVKSMKGHSFHRLNVYFMEATGGPFWSSPFISLSVRVDVAQMFERQLLQQCFQIWNSWLVSFLKYFSISTDFTHQWSGSQGEKRGLYFPRKSLNSMTEVEKYCSVDTSVTDISESCNGWSVWGHKVVI